MPVVPCPAKIDCQPCSDEPILNISAEASDVDRYISRFAFLSPFPPIRQFPDFDEQGGGIFLQVGCMRWCWSTISQDDADDCARRQAIECAFQAPIPPPDEFHPNRISLYYNQAVTGTYTCPDGNVFSYTIAANQVVALTQGEANAIAFALAKLRANQHRVCISDMDDPICVDTWATKQITASGPNVAVFPATDLWQLVSGTIPPGMTLETGFTSDGIELSGIPNTIGEYSFRVRCTISTFGSPGYGDFMEKVFAVKIVGIEQSSPLPDAPLGVAYSQQLSASFSSNHELETWSITSGNLPDGLTLSTAGLIEGTPTGALAGYSFTVQAQFPVGTTTAVCSKPMSITTVPTPVPISYWKLEEIASPWDDAVDANDLTPVLSDPPSITGVIGNGVRCNGTGAFLEKLGTTNLWIYANGITMAGWFKFLGPVLSDPGNQGSAGFVMAGGTSRFMLGGNAAGQLFAQATIPFGGTSSVVLAGLAIGAWTFIRMWVDPSDNELHCKLNEGATLSGTAMTFVIPVPAMNLFLQGAPLCDVEIDEVGVYSGVMTDEEASYLYNGGSAQRPPLP